MVRKTVIPRKSVPHCFCDDAQRHPRAPEDLLRRLKVTAAQNDTSISGMLTDTLQRVADQEEGYEEARRGMLADLGKGRKLGTHGKIAWSRDSVHER